MSPFVRKVRTASGATAVQIVAKEHGVRRIVEHLGSAHDEAELAVLVRAGRDRITALSGQAALDLESLGAGACVAGAVVDSKRCALLRDALSGAYERLGLRWAGTRASSRWRWPAASSPPARSRSPA